jgi:hypothetical protein
MRLRNAATIGLSLLLIGALFLAFGGIRMAPRPAALVIETATGAAVVAFSALLLAFGRGRSMLGRPTAWLVGASLLVPVVLLVWKIYWSTRYPDMSVTWPTRPGFRCLRLSLILGVIALSALAFVRRRSDPVHPRALGLALGAAAGAGTWVLVDLWCPVAFIPHLLLGHVLPLIVLATLGVVLGRTILGIGER